MVRLSDVVPTLSRAALVAMMPGTILHDEGGVTRYDPHRRIKRRWVYSRRSRLRVVDEAERIVRGRRGVMSC